MSVRLQGKLYVRGDSKIFRFQNGKTESLFLQRKNPRRIAWTTLYRRQHKKGISEVSKNILQNCIEYRIGGAGLHTGRRHKDYGHCVNTRPLTILPPSPVSQLRPMNSNH